MIVDSITEEIRTKLSHYKPKFEKAPPNFKQASVLIPFYLQPTGLHMVFMKRPNDQGPHSGQISFPGGSRDESDNDESSVALRETEEEFGVNRDSIELWGRLKPQFTSVSNFWVTPFVGILPYPANFSPSKTEVERLLIIPFSLLRSNHSFSVGTYNWKGFEVPSYLYRYKHDVIWGLTARILFNLITLIETGCESNDPWPPT